MKIPYCLSGFTCLILTAAPVPLRAEEMTHTHSFFLQNDAAVTLDTFLNLGLLTLLDSQSSEDFSTLGIIFDQFDPGLGILDSVTFRFTTTAAPTNLTVSQANLLTVGVLSSAGANQALSLTDTLAGVDLSGAASISRNQATLLGLGLGGGSTSVPTSGPLLTLNTTFSSLPELAAFTGNGTFGLDVTSQMLLSLSTVAGLAVTGPPSLTGSATYSGTAEVTYNFTPVPEASSAALMLAGLAPLFRRRR